MVAVSGWGSNGEGGGGIMKGRGEISEGVTGWVST